MNLSSINKKFFTYIIIALGAVIGIFVVIFIINIFKGKRLSFENLEIALKDAAVSYYEDNNDLLPKTEEGIVSVDNLILSEAGYIKPIEKITKKGYTCTGEVKVQKNGENYLYTPYLNCGEDYKTTNLVDKIKENNPIITDNPIVTTNGGLYQAGENLIFRGEIVNNYVSFSGKLWRIIRINSDGTLRLLQDDIVYTGVWDDRYNINREDNTGINDFTISRLQDGLDKIYNELDMFNDNAKSKIALKDLCIGARYEDETNNTGSVECAKVAKNKPIGLMQVNEYMAASLDPNCVHSYDAQCANYNYLSAYQKSTWTLTADASNTHKAYKFYGNVFSPSTTSSESGLRLVIYLSSNLPFVGGTGTLEDPYIVK